MPRTSNKAQLIMDYVNQFIQENGYSPSVREIGAAVGLRSTASVSYHLQALQHRSRKERTRDRKEPESRKVDNSLLQKRHSQQSIQKK